MNISKNTEKRLLKINGNLLKSLPPIDSMDTWGAPVPDFIEKRTWSLKGILTICLVVMVVMYVFKDKFALSLKQQVVTQKTLPQKLEAETVQLRLDTDTTVTELADYSTNTQQAYLKIAPEVVPVLMKETEVLNEDDSETQETFEITAQQIRTWLHQQHIQGVAYKDFESCIVINGKIFHLNEVVAPELNLVWSDIDPVAKKLFFYDVNGTLYFINY